MQLLSKGAVLNKRYSVEDAVILPERNYVIYSCTDINDKKRVTIKEFFPDYAQRGQDNAVIYKEEHESELKNFSVANALAEKYGCLPTIPAVSDIFEENNTCYAVCESFSGKTVSEIVGMGKSFSPDSVRKMMITLAKTAEAFEKVGISYSGFSPEEVWITTDGYIKLTDYEAMADKTKQNDAIKAIVAVAYYMLTGEKALVGAKRAKTARKNLPGDMGKYIVGILNGKVTCISAAMLLDDINSGFKQGKRQRAKSGEVTVSAKANKKSKKRTALVLCICGGLLVALCAAAAGLFLWQGMASVTPPTTTETEIVVDTQIPEETPQPTYAPEATSEPEQKKDDASETSATTAPASSASQTAPQKTSSPVSTPKSSGNATSSARTPQPATPKPTSTPTATSQTTPKPTATATSTPNSTATPSAPTSTPVQTQTPQENAQ